VLAGRLAVALDNARLLDAERQLEALVTSMEDAVTMRDMEGRIVLANEAAIELMGAASLDDLRALAVEEMWSRYALYDPEGRPLHEQQLSWVEALRTQRNPPPLLYRQVARETGRQRWLVSKASVVRGQDDAPAMVMNVTEDVTAVKRAEIGQRLLVEAGRLLSGTLDVDATLQEIAELTVPTLADWCGIDVPGPGGSLHQRAVAHIEPEKVALAHRLRSLHPVGLDDDSALARVNRTGEPARMDNITPEMVRAAALDEEHLALLEGLGLSALMVVPLRTGDDVLGSLSLVASQPHRRFDDADQEVAEALGRRVADALRNARLLRDRTEIAHVLSSGLRPDASPILPGCEVAAVYQPAGEDVEAGGDFYEVIDAPSGSIVVMGDVVGKGAPAAALSAVARVTLRTAGRLTGEPRAALDELNHVLRRRGGMSLCTVVAVALPSELPGTAEVLLAGHPPPLLVRDGVAQPIGRHGPMLGAVEVAEWPPATVELAPGDVLVLYTDGVLDSVLPGGERFGEERLRRVAERAGQDVGRLAEMVEEQLERLRLRDDVALLAIRCPGPPALLARGTLDGDAALLLELTLPGGPAAPRAARHALAAALAGRLSQRAEGDALIVVSELVTNAIRHGGAPDDRYELTLHAALRETGLRIEVTDPGAGFEPGGHGPRPDGGYGLHLLDRLASRWGVAGAEPVTVWVELDR
jgi:PAS domain S-box-containing protein